ncbi:MAG: hypothetical protein AAFU61_18365, partial [Pseudomonadota bacterium]
GGGGGGSGGLLLGAPTRTRPFFQSEAEADFDFQQIVTTIMSLCVSVANPKLAETAVPSVPLRQGPGRLSAPQEELAEALVVSEDSAAAAAAAAAAAPEVDDEATLLAANALCILIVLLGSDPVMASPDATVLTLLVDWLRDQSPRREVLSILGAVAIAALCKASIDAPP